MKEKFLNEGFVLIKNLISHEKIDSLLKNHLQIVNDVTGNSFIDPFGSDIVNFYHNNPDMESLVYDKTLKQDWLQEFSQGQEITSSVKQLMDNDIGLFKKIPFRMDMPFWTKELAHWHQDNYYVKGDTNGITAWIPMQDTTYINGCLSVMPRSHLMGPVDHDLKIGKKSIPSTIFEREIRMVEMKKGDLLLFSTLLLHSSNINLSSSIRYSLQPRFTHIDSQVDEGMWGVIQL